jgi:hypothetical protein
MFVGVHCCTWKIVFWVFPRRLSIKSRRFGTLCRFHLLQVVKCVWELVGLSPYLYVKRGLAVVLVLAVGRCFLTRVLRNIVRVSARNCGICMNIYFFCDFKIPQKFSNTPLKTKKCFNFVYYSRSWLMYRSCFKQFFSTIIYQKVNRVPPP